MPVPEGRERYGSPQDVWLWLSQFEQPFLKEIETAVCKLWLHEGGVLQELPPDAASLLHLRIVTAEEWISGFVTTEECPFDYPNGSFQEVVQWLLVHWWDTHGLHRASQVLFLRD